MDEFEVLLDLVDFELVVAVPDGAVGLFVVVAAGLDGVVEEVVPVEVLVVLFHVLLEGDAFLLGYAQLQADYLGEVGGRYLLARQEVPDE